MDLTYFFYNGWGLLVRTLAVGALAYVVLVLFLRVAGKRTLAKMNAFDFVVTVALGSTLASILVSKDVSLAQGVLALGLLIGLQFAISWSSVRARWVRHWVTGDPLMLLYRGEFQPKAMRRARVTADEVRSAVRSSGFASLADVEAVVLETDGSFSVVGRAEGVGGEGSSLKGVDGWPGEEGGRGRAGSE